MPRQIIMLLRHAEKPDAALGEIAVDRRGTKDDNGLSVRGWQRAGALVRFFSPLHGHAPDSPLAEPAAIFAAAPSPAHPSRRPAETVRPLAEALDLPIDQQHRCEDDPQAMIDALDACDGPALVCWRHDELPRLACALAGGAQVPAQWPSAQYDRVWVIERGGADPRFEVLAQRLLPGDRL